jgi:uncharacterized protein
LSHLHKTSALQDTLALNNCHAAETSILDLAALVQMLANAYFSITDDAHGLLIAFDQDANYDGVNFHWFKSRFDRFVYIDRIVVASHTRGKGLARHYYTRLFDKAKSAGHSRITCEINLDPPNPGSISFHANMGFTEIGQALLENGKTVSYQEKLL